MAILGNALLKRHISSSALLLDGVPNVIHGYSTRKLLTTYSGYCVEIQTNGGYSTVGFLNNSLNTSQVYSIGSPYTSAVAGIYDQVGSENLVQPALSSQPIIVYNGTLLMAGGHPTLSFNNQNLVSTSNIPQFPLTIIAVIEITGSTNGAFVKCGDSASGVGIGVGNGYNVDNPGVGIVGLNEGISWVSEIGTSISTSEMAIVEVNATGSRTNVYLNGVLISLNTNAYSPINYYYLGGYSGQGIYPRFPSCKISENIVFDTIISDITRSTIVGNMKDYYGIT